MATKKEEISPADKRAEASKITEAERKQPKASEAKKVTKKTESAAEIDVVQSKKTVTIRKKPEAPKARKTGRISGGRGSIIKARDIGVDIEKPSKDCDDPNCPFHGTLSVRGFSFDVQLVSKKMERTVVVMRERRHYIKKYQRFEKRSSRFFAHMPPCIEADIGDMVRVMECRPVSKGTTMVVIGRI
ncbi:MAG: 30S ribosomal protein S17 [Candidatus Thermoplasmatota archaeon]|nr:30S ribosomal protein S17 [Candidatus Thermoplasmatota archaeon]